MTQPQHQVRVKSSDGWIDLVVPGPQGQQGETGPTGPQGPAGSMYTHYQGPSSAHWVVIHNLGFNPNVVVIDSAGSVVEGEMTYTNSNSLTLDFSGAFSGAAYLS